MSSRREGLGNVRRTVNQFERESSHDGEDLHVPRNRNYRESHNKNEVQNQRPSNKDNGREDRRDEGRRYDEDTSSQRRYDKDTRSQRRYEKDACSEQRRYESSEDRYEDTSRHRRKRIPERYDSEEEDWQPKNKRDSSRSRETSKRDKRETSKRDKRGTSKRREDWSEPESRYAADHRTSRDSRNTDGEYSDRREPIRQRTRKPEERDSSVREKTGRNEAFSHRQDRRYAEKDQAYRDDGTAHQRDYRYQDDSFGQRDSRDTSRPTRYSERDYDTDGRSERYTDKTRDASAGHDRKTTSRHSEESFNQRDRVGLHSGDQRTTQVYEVDVRDGDQIHRDEASTEPTSKKMEGDWRCSAERQISRGHQDQLPYVHAQPATNQENKKETTSSTSYIGKEMGREWRSAERHRSQQDQLPYVHAPPGKSSWHENEEEASSTNQQALVMLKREVEELTEQLKASEARKRNQAEEINKIIDQKDEEIFRKDEELHRKDEELCQQTERAETLSQMLKTTEEKLQRSEKESKELKECLAKEKAKSKRLSEEVRSRDQSANIHVSGASVSRRPSFSSVTIRVHPDNYHSRFVDDLLEQLLSMLKARNVRARLDVGEHESTPGLGNIVVLVPVVASSRIGTDIQAALAKARLASHRGIILIIFHCLATHNSRIRVPTRNKLYDRELVADCRLMVDAVFWDGQLYTCRANEMLVEELSKDLLA